MKEEIKTKDMTKCLSKSIIEREVVTTTLVLPRAAFSKALMLANTPHVPENNDCHSLDLVDRAAAPQLVEEQFIEGGVVYVKQVMNTTTTTIIKRSEMETSETDEDIDTPIIEVSLIMIPKKTSKQTKLRTKEIQLK